MVSVLPAGGTAMLVALLGTPLFIRFLPRRGHRQRSTTTSSCTTSSAASPPWAEP